MADESSQFPDFSDTSDDQTVAEGSAASSAGLGSSPVTGSFALAKRRELRDQLRARRADEQARHDALEAQANNDAGLGEVLGGADCVGADDSHPAAEPSSGSGGAAVASEPGQVSGYGSGGDGAQSSRAVAPYTGRHAAAVPDSVVQGRRRIAAQIEEAARRQREHADKMRASLRERSSRLHAEREAAQQALAAAIAAAQQVTGQGRVGAEVCEGPVTAGVTIPEIVEDNARSGDAVDEVVATVEPADRWPEEQSGGGQACGGLVGSGSAQIDVGGGRPSADGGVEAGFGAGSGGSPEVSTSMPAPDDQVGRCAPRGESMADMSADDGMGQALWCDDSSGGVVPGEDSPLQSGGPGPGVDAAEPADPAVAASTDGQQPDTPHGYFAQDNANSAKRGAPAAEGTTGSVLDGIGVPQWPVLPRGAPEHDDPQGQGGHNWIDADGMGSWGRLVVRQESWGLDDAETGELFEPSTTDEDDTWPNYHQWHPGGAELPRREIGEPGPGDGEETTSDAFLQADGFAVPPHQVGDTAHAEAASQVPAPRNSDPPGCAAGQFPSVDELVSRSGFDDQTDGVISDDLANASAAVDEDPFVVTPDQVAGATGADANTTQPQAEQNFGEATVKVPRHEHLEHESPMLAPEVSAEPVVSEDDSLPPPVVSRAPKTGSWWVTTVPEAQLAPVELTDTPDGLCQEASATTQDNDPPASGAGVVEAPLAAMSPVLPNPEEPTAENQASAESPAPPVLRSEPPVAPNAPSATADVGDEEPARGDRQADLEAAFGVVSAPTAHQLQSQQEPEVRLQTPAEAWWAAIEAPPSAPAEHEPDQLHMLWPQLLPVPGSEGDGERQDQVVSDGERLDQVPEDSQMSSPAESLAAQSFDEAVVAGHQDVITPPVVIGDQGQTPGPVESTGDGAADDTLEFAPVRNDDRPVPRIGERLGNEAFPHTHQVSIVSSEEPVYQELPNGTKVRKTPGSLPTPAQSLPAGRQEGFLAGLPQEQTQDACAENGDSTQRAEHQSVQPGSVAWPTFAEPEQPESPPQPTKNLDALLHMPPQPAADGTALDETETNEPAQVANDQGTPIVAQPAAVSHPASTVPEPGVLSEHQLYTYPATHIGQLPWQPGVLPFTNAPLVAVTTVVEPQTAQLPVVTGGYTPAADVAGDTDQTPQEVLPQQPQTGDACDECLESTPEQPYATATAGGIKSEPDTTAVTEVADAGAENLKTSAQEAPTSSVESPLSPKPVGAPPSQTQQAPGTDHPVSPGHHSHVPVSSGERHHNTGDISDIVEPDSAAHWGDHDQPTTSQLHQATAGNHSPSAVGDFVGLDNDDDMAATWQPSQQLPHRSEIRRGSDHLTPEAATPPEPPATHLDQGPPLVQADVAAQTAAQAELVEAEPVDAEVVLDPPQPWTQTGGDDDTLSGDDTDLALASDSVVDAEDTWWQRQAERGAVFRERMTTRVDESLAATKRNGSRWTANKKLWVVLLVLGLLAAAGLVGVAVDALRFTGEPAQTMPSVGHISDVKTTAVVIREAGDDSEVVQAAVVGAVPHAASLMVVPQALSMGLPGASQTPLGAVDGPAQALQDVLRVRVDATWTVNKSDIVALVDAAGGVPMQVTTAFETGGEVVQVGAYPALTGAEVWDYAVSNRQGESVQAQSARWAQVLVEVLRLMPEGEQAVVEKVREMTGRGLLKPGPQTLGWAGSAVRSGDYGTLVVPTTVLNYGGGDSVLVIDEDEARSMLESRFGDAYTPPAASATKVLVQNGYGAPGLVAHARRRLHAMSDVQVTAAGNAVRLQQNTSSVLVPNDSEESRRVGYAIAEALEVPASAVMVATEAPTVVDVVVVLGEDFHEAVNSRDSSASAAE